MGVIAKSGACVISIVTQISFGAVTARNIYWQKGLNIKYLGGLNTRGPFQVTWSVMGCCTTPGKKKEKGRDTFWLGLRTRCESVPWFLPGNHHKLVLPKSPHKGLKCQIIWQQNLFLPTMRIFCNHKAITRTNNENDGWTCHSVTILDTILTDGSCIIWPCHHLLALTELQKVKVKSQSLPSFPQACYYSEQPGSELKEKKRVPSEEASAGVGKLFDL